MEIVNDSAAHAGHAAMRAQGGGTGETHFTVNVISRAFEGKVTRHTVITFEILKGPLASSETDAPTSNDLQRTRR